MAMSRKHFRELAAIFAEANSQASPIVDLRWIASEVANVCKRDNGNFDRAKFLTACGFVVDMGGNFVKEETK